MMNWLKLPKPMQRCAILCIIVSEVPKAAVLLLSERTWELPLPHRMTMLAWFRLGMMKCKTSLMVLAVQRVQYVVITLRYEQCM